jgi:AcrR family transcriptional regulator
MRRVASELGMATMTLYNYLPAKITWLSSS